MVNDLNRVHPTELSWYTLLSTYLLILNPNGYDLSHYIGT